MRRHRPPPVPGQTRWCRHGQRRSGTPKPGRAWRSPPAPPRSRTAHRQGDATRRRPARSCQPPRGGWSPAPACSRHVQRPAGKARELVDTARRARCQRHRLRLRMLGRGALVPRFARAARIRSSPQRGEAAVSRALARARPPTTSAATAREQARRCRARVRRVRRSPSVLACPAGRSPRGLSTPCLSGRRV